MYGLLKPSTAVWLKTNSFKMINKKSGLKQCLVYIHKLCNWSTLRSHDWTWNISYAFTYICSVWKNCYSVGVFFVSKAFSSNFKKESLNQFHFISFIDQFVHLVQCTVIKVHVSMDIERKYHVECGKFTVINKHEA